MKLYHGSPKKLLVIQPTLARGITAFENQKAVFLCKTFLHAALYAIGKTLKGKTPFLITEKKLVIVGNKRPRDGYVYCVDVQATKGPRGQYAYDKEIKDFTVEPVNAKNYDTHITRVETIEELKRLARNNG